MNFKLKALVAAVVMVAATSANATATQAAGGNSSLVFSAWDADVSYSLDLGSFLNDFIGADNAANIGGAATPPNATFIGAVAADGTIFDTVLNGFNLTAGSWNLAAADSLGRYRMLLSSGANGITTTNNQIKNGALALNNYYGTGAGDSTTTGTIATSADAWYANSAAWGDGIASSAITGTSNDLGASSNLYVGWQNSATQGTSASGFADLMTATGSQIFATTYVDTLGATHFKIATAVAAVPEADTSAMMLAGLGLMGLVARRRNRKQA